MRDWHRSSNGTEWHTKESFGCKVLIMKELQMVERYSNKLASVVLMGRWPLCHLLFTIRDLLCLLGWQSAHT